MATAVASREAAAPAWRLRLPDRLPDLKGAWLTAYMIVWAIVFAIATVGPIRSQYLLSGYFAHPAWQAYGIVTTVSTDGIVIVAVSSDEARLSGVRAGDQIIRIDGWKVPASGGGSALVRNRVVKPDGSRTDFTIASRAEAPKNVRLTFSRKHFEELYARGGLTAGWTEALLIGGNLLVSLAFVASAVLLFLRQRRKAVLALLSLAFLIIGSTDWGSDWSDLGLSRTFISLVELAGWGLFFLALFAFPSGRFTPRWTRVAIPLLPFVIMLGLLIRSNFYLPACVGALLLAVIAALIVRYRALPADPERQQLRWVFFGFVAGSGMLVLDIIGLLICQHLQSTDARWFVWTRYPDLLGDAGVVVIALGLMVSILRYRLYDADTIIGRSAAYGVLTLGFIALFAGAEKLAEIVGERYFEHSIGIVAGAAGAAVAAACIVPLHNRVHRWAERRFQKPLIRLRDGLPELVADLRESAPLDHLLSAVMSRVEAGVRSTREAVLLMNKGQLRFAGAREISPKAARAWQSRWRPTSNEGALDCDRRDPVFPLRVPLQIESSGEPETIGWLLLGPRPDGSFFGKDEREALADIAGPVARAIHIAQLREKREAEAERRIGGLEALIEKLAAAIGTGGAAAPA